MKLGNNILHTEKKQATGAFVTIGGERFYEITHYDAMQPFFISLASDTDLWMYIASTGGLTAGRRNPDQALFPYYTDDKITENYEHTGSKTIVRVERDGQIYLWEPFSNRYMGVYDITRKIAKSVVGNKLIFTEENHTLDIAFSYQYSPTNRFGWVRKVTLQRLGSETLEPLNVEILDGLQNVLPAGTDRLTQNTFSTLVDGYKKTERVENSSLVLFRMEAIMVDRAEPSESLRCNTICTLGLQEADYLVSSRQLDTFRLGKFIEPEPEAKGVRGAIFAHTALTLQPAESHTWYFLADVMQDTAQVYDTLHFLQQEDAIEQVEQAIACSTYALWSIVAQNDGVQETADEHGMARHFANTLFNTMRGGFYCDDYQIQGAAFSKHVTLFNKAVAEQHKVFLASLPDTINYHELQKQIEAQNDAQLMRLFMEYLPLTFSRRHGDPSRPWNLFDIRVNDAEGNRLISYQGNWRDIFQNWEALSLSYPDYVNGIISKFLNATTVDGYNPYKVTSEGIDWEVIEPENPWSNIGYWGDHQVIYLLRLLELSYKHNPKAIQQALNSKQYAFANVPYRLKSYNEIVVAPKNSIRFDDALHNHIFSQLPTYGQDARLLLDAKNEVYLTTFTEKIAITFLAKFSNLIPEAGIWMNTLRPEWNDANNALVGYGASMVTLYYMRRFVAFLLQVYKESNITQLTLSAEVKAFIEAVVAVMNAHNEALDKGFIDSTRRTFTDGVEQAAEAYRNKVYRGFSQELQILNTTDWLAFLQQALTFIDQSIRVNKREDGLYHAYNLIHFTEDAIEVKHLYEMLEGQVAVLTADVLTAEEVADLLDVVRHSALYREDQNSYMLYPAKRLSSFLEKNNIPAEAAQWPIIQHLLNNYKGDIITQDRQGGLHFNGAFNNADFLARALDNLPENIEQTDRQALLDLYEQMFNHQAFTGRSGTFYKYEGLGCIYWHMVSKYLLAVGENIAQAVHNNADTAVINRLRQHYWNIQAGIGAHKLPEEYGSFPFDAYSHTPSMAGVQQPGMTGQVKEDIINRFFELGLRVENGEIHIDTTMLREEEFLNSELRFTYCAVPFVYKLSQFSKGEIKSINITHTNGIVETIAGRIIPAGLAKHIFSRNGQIKQIIVNLQ